MNLSNISKRLIFVICISAAVIIAVGAVYYRSALALPFALGVFLAAGLNCLKIVMIERVAIKITQMGEGVQGYVGMQYLFRLLLTGVVLFVCHISPFINLWGAVIGIFTLQVATLSLRFFDVSDEAVDNRP